MRIPSRGDPHLRAETSLHFHLGYVSMLSFSGSEDHVTRQNMVLTLAVFVFFCGARGARGQAAIDSKLDREMPTLLATYKALHAAPELSHQEEKTSALVARELRELGYAVTERVGKYTGHPGWTSYGVVGVLSNGEGRTVYVRTELDALPVEERTGLPYASQVRAKDDSGREVSVMHACGHDIHITSFLGTAKMLAELKNEWQGTVVMLAQPAEEAIDGARAMLDDGLYARFPRPDYVLALHDSPGVAAGAVGYTPGYAMASSTSVDVTLRGVGGHGSAPQAAKDPIVEAAEFILAIQTIVSREDSPFDPAVVTVGSIHGGTRYNIIPDDVHLQLTIRTYKEEVRQHIIQALERMAQGIAAADGIPASRAPIVKVSDEYAPATYNDPQLTLRLAGVFKKVLGPENVVETPPLMASEDFGRLGLENHQIPTCQFSLGAVDAAKLEESRRTGVPLPGLHSSLWAPVAEPTIRTGVKSMTSAVLELMKKPAAQE